MSQIRATEPEDAEAIARVHVASWRTTSPACRYYERFGGVLVTEGTHTVDGHPYPDRRYGYPDVIQLLGTDAAQNRNASSTGS